MNRGSSITVLIGCVVAATGAVSAAEFKLDLGGRISPQIVVATYPDESAFDEIFGSSSIDSAVDARVIFGAQSGRWNFDLDYQLVGLYADTLEFTRELPPELQILFPPLPDDRTRLFDLTHVFTDSGKSAAYQRLDRMAVRYASSALASSPCRR